jgi:hypothetical protein
VTSPERGQRGLLSHPEPLRVTSPERGQRGLLKKHQVTFLENL